MSDLINHADSFKQLKQTHQQLLSIEARSSLSLQYDPEDLRMLSPIS